LYAFIIISLPLSTRVRGWKKIFFLYDGLPTTMRDKEANNEKGRHNKVKIKVVGQEGTG